MSTETNSPDPASAPRKLATVKLYCRCGQKVRINLPAPKPSGRCPKCGHAFVLPQVPLEYRRPAEGAAPTPAPAPGAGPDPSRSATPTPARASSTGEGRGLAG